MAGRLCDRHPEGEVGAGAIAHRAAGGQLTRDLPADAYSWQTDAGLYLTGSEEPRRFGRMVAGERVWEVPWGEVFPDGDFFTPIDDFRWDASGEVIPVQTLPGETPDDTRIAGVLSHRRPAAEDSLRRGGRRRSRPRPRAPRRP